MSFSVDRTKEEILQASSQGDAERVLRTPWQTPELKLDLTVCAVQQHDQQESQNALSTLVDRYIMTLDCLPLEGQITVSA